MLSSAMGLCSKFLERNPLCWLQNGLFGGSHGTPLTNNSNGCDSILVLEASFYDKKWPTATQLLGDFI